MKVLVTGINGFVGKNLESYLQNSSLLLGGLLRTNRQVSYCDTQLHFFDTFDNADVENITCGYDCIIHLAALVHQPDQKDIEQYMRLNCDFTVKLARAAIANGVGKFIFLSTSHVYEGIDSVYHEQLELKPTSPYAQSKHQASLSLLRLFSGINSKLYIIRPPLIYGQGVKGNMKSLSKLINKTQLTPFLLARAKRSYICIDNLCSFILHLIDADVQPGIYNVSDNDDLSTSELSSLIAAANDKQLFQLPIPKNIMKLFFSIVRKQDQWEKIYSEFRLNINKAISTGWKPKPIDYRDFVL